jgi:pimeloyl-ACP methyl ester carboxylesterase
MSKESMTVHPMVLLGGYSLAPWAWDEVRPRLEAEGHRVEVPTLPGLGDGTPPDTVTLADQATAVLACLRTLDRPVLVVHSGAGAIASLVTDIEPQAVSRVIYVDSGPVSDGQVPRPDLAGLAVVPAPTVQDLDSRGRMTEDLSAEQKAEFAARALPQPGLVANQPVRLTNPDRLDVPSTLLCCSFPSAEEQRLAREGDPMFAPTLELHDLDYVDLPGGHWPMFAQPAALAACLVRVSGR